MELVQLSHKEFLQIDKDYSKAAKTADLRYMHDSEPGIARKKHGAHFTYIYDDNPLKDTAELERIKKLAIPPAWTNVWICPLENGHIQATGFDARNRKQYRYHSLWHTVRNATKFHHMYEFAKALPALRQRLEDDLKRTGICEERVLATVISLMERTYIRIGSNDYEKLYGSYGLTTLKDKHVDIKGDEINFSFKGKKGVFHKISLTNQRLARTVKACRDIAGKELFQYYDARGERRAIDSGMVNRYIKEAMGGDYSAKDFRTWAGTLNILRAFKSMGEAGSQADIKKNVVAALEK